MIRLPWQITRKMFLSEDEVDRLLAHVAKNSGEAGPDAVTAQVDAIVRSHWSFQNEAALTSAPDFTVVSCAF